MLVLFVNSELESVWKEAVMVQSRYYSGIFLEGLRKSTEKLNQGSMFPGRDSNQAPLEYKCRALPLYEQVRQDIYCS
jgi:hypothetical protein